MKKYFYPLLIFCLFSGFHSAYSNEKFIKIDKSKESYRLGLQLKILEDKDKEWTIKDVSSEPVLSRFEKSSEIIPNRGITHSAYWVMFKINNDQDLTQWLLEVGYPQLDHISLFSQKNDRAFSEIKAGDMLPFHKRDIKHRNFIFKLNLPRNEISTFYMRFETEGTLQIPLRIVSPEVFALEEHEMQFGLGLYYGIILVMILYNLFIFFSVRDKTYLLYVLYIFIYAVAQISLNGLAYEYLWPNSPQWHNDSLMFFVGMASSFIGIFSRSYLNTRVYIPRIHKIISALIVLNIMAAGTSFFVPYSIAMKLVLSISGVLMVLLLPSGIICWIKGNRSASFYVFAWGTLLLGIIAVYLKSAGFLPSNFVTEYGMQIGSALEVILLSLGLADRINIMKRERVQNQEKIIEMQRSYSESLEKTVHERTCELENERNKLKARNQVMATEVALARKIQDQLIPNGDPVDYIYSLYKPMELVGGDFYDFIFFRDSNKIGIFISDVSGHGVPAAFITTMVKSTIMQSGRRKEDPAALMSYINDMLQNQTAGNFITAFYGIYDPEENEIIYANAGHPQPYLINEKNITQLEKGRNTPLAVFPNVLLEAKNKQYVNFRKKLPLNSKLLLFTDGLLEATPHDNYDLFFEHADMFKIFLEFQHEQSEVFINQLHARLVDFTGKKFLEDDVCLICLHVQ